MGLPQKAKSSQPLFDMNWSYLEYKIILGVLIIIGIIIKKCLDNPQK
jgi:hypothetical protein